MGTATSNLKIIVDIVGDPQQSKKINTQITEIAKVAGVVAAAGIAAKQAWDFTKEGAQLELTAQQFANVATNAGYMSDVLLGKMREASKGMVSDADLMASGLRIIELGLAKDQESISTLATAVSVLGLDMQQVIMTFANNSELRLDSLGLSVDNVRARVKELNAEGFDGDAFDQAVLDGLIQRMEVLGDTSETTAGKMQMLETVWTNTVDRMKGAAVDIAAPLIDAASAEEQLKQAADAGIITRERANELINRATWGYNEYTDGLISVTHHEYTFAEALDEVAARTEYLNQLQGYAAIEAERFDDKERGLIQTTKEIAEVYDYSAEKAQFAAKANEQYSRSFADIYDTSSRAFEPVSELLDGINRNIASPVDAFIGDLEWFIATGGKFEETFQKIQNADVTPSQKLEWAQDLAGYIEDASDAVDSGDADSLAGALAGLDDITIEMQSIGYAKQQAEEFAAQLQRITDTNWVVNVSLNTPTVHGVSGGSSGGSGGPGNGVIGSYASGTGGWSTVPETGLYQLHKGEDMNIGYGARNQSTGGGSTIIIENIEVMDGSDFLAVLGDMQRNASRNDDSYSAGAGYIG